MQFYCIFTTQLHLFTYDKDLIVRMIKATRERRKPYRQFQILVLPFISPVLEP